MARPLRIQYSGAWYHVMNRGTARRAVFLATADREGFLRLIGEVATRYLVEFHAFCLMSNHYHLLVRTPQPSLGRAMRHLDDVYAQRFHRRHGTDGPLFRGRYRAILLQADRHLVAVSRYVHLNPVEAGLVARPEDWPFSSYRAYLGSCRTPMWLTTRMILGFFGTIGARLQYRRFVEEGLDPGTRDFYGRERLPPVLGDDAFREELLRRAALELDRDGGELADLCWLEREGTVPLGAIARAVCEVFAVPQEALRPGSRKNGRESGLARGALVHAARRLGGYRMHEIAAWLGYASYSAAARAAVRFGEAARSDPSLARRLAAVLDRVREA